MYQIDFHTPSHIYFCGIGGISMSGLAEILLKRGFRISGSDMRASSLTEHLSQAGAQVYIGQKAENITDDIDCVIFTAAIHRDNPEFQETMRRGLPMLSRAELLGQLMINYACPIAVSGTHGKTTTTSMISEILMAAGTDPTVSVGGMLNSIGGNIRIGNGPHFVAEACEYTNSFLSMYPKVALILNIEEDHLDFFKDLDDIRHSFHLFAKKVPSDGLLIINGDIDHYEQLTCDLSCRVVTFGTAAQNDYYPVRISSQGEHGMTADIMTPDGAVTLTLHIPGRHNIYNAMAALAAADALGVDREISLAALCHFEGSQRRFEYKGSFNGVTVIDDYAHHPTEIISTLAAAADCPHKKLWCVFQPHTYSRTKALLDDFAHALSKADAVVLADIYAARETDTLGISSQDLCDRIRALGTECYYLPDFASIENFLSKKCIHKDMLITMGAGDIVKVGEALVLK
ncbi:MAG: UDP-N-acetylmuramate--L-alanine ligase [Lachnospiraceae bacterium]|nr:UDP-N-acetylmuramate--L-alanine ligase [Lachnospiraceae bacterium]